MDFKTILTEAKTLAIIGCSDKEYTTSYSIARKMQREGYRIIPVNPNHDEVLGETCYPGMTAIPDEIAIDIAVIFRRPEFTEEMVESIVEWTQKTGKKPVVWTQLGVSSPAAENLAATHGLDYVKNHCIAVEHSKYIR